MRIDQVEYSILVFYEFMLAPESQMSDRIHAHAGWQFDFARRRPAQVGGHQPAATDNVGVMGGKFTRHAFYLSLTPKRLFVTGICFPCRRLRRNCMTLARYPSRHITKRLLEVEKVGIDMAGSSGERS